ncbi:ATP-binding cassette domain-containing protein [Patescibacteria group bacterium]|nr:ATP-binding cassette domain-containing protein [Patescibacteria group bacterium]MCL5091428.1 ATP-binding cassette domain-containing protein [Patescibacteria group bacterium]
MIQFDNVAKQFPLGNAALANLTFTIPDNDFVFLVGPSGAGKTTILKLILRELIPNSGTIKVDDFVLTDKRFRRVEKLREKIGVVFQDFKILPDKNIWENVALGMQIINAPANAIKIAVKEALRLVNLTGKEAFFPVQLSAGELQRAAIARAICGNRHIILADEPTGNLDPNTTWEIMKIFRKFEGKKTIIIATHNTDIVNSLNKRVLTIKNGKLVKDTQKGKYEL